MRVVEPAPGTRPAREELFGPDGARSVEGCPVDTAGAKKGAGDLYCGALADAWFEPVERRGANRALVRLAT